MIKHATASVFVFCEFPQGWCLGLIEHPRLHKCMIVGGHVEGDETQAEAAVREAAEESGLRVRLLAGPSPGLPRGYPHERVAAPWWITEVMVPADNHVPAPHIHVDHQYVAIAESPLPVSEPAHPFGRSSRDTVARSCRRSSGRIGSGAARLPLRRGKTWGRSVSSNSVIWSIRCAISASRRASSRRPGVRRAGSCGRAGTVG